jgi:hypothetical protein
VRNPEDVTELGCGKHEKQWLPFTLYAGEAKNLMRGAPVIKDLSSMIR